MTLQEWMGIASTVGFGGMTLWKFLESRKVDARSAQSGVASDNRAGIDQLVEGLNKLVDQLQEENDKLRAGVDSRDSLLNTYRLEIARLRRKHGNGNGNGDTPQPPNKEV